ncbi:MAG: LCP family protein [Chloroflexi bacterium]|nr:LCP family protein [Chloroflexota bacterium]MCL5025112.1 LCP family protein [Chloroflexota bacterium]
MAEELKEEEFYEEHRQSPVPRVAVIFLAFFVAGGLYFGYVFVHTTITIFSAAFALNWAPLPQPPFLDPMGVSSDTAFGSSAAEGAPLPGGRVNILLLGIDQRDDERQRGVPSRSDTMILVSVDPATRSGGILSIPRDLWVAIPGGYKDNKINVANFLGDMDKLPGGGPALAKRTVELNFGLPVHYYVRANFRGFESIIDALGGVDIDVQKHILDREYPTQDYGYMTVEFMPGMQHMNGVRALQYARTRHDDNDFYRNKRQQQVLLAARNKLMRIDVLPRLPALLGAAKNAVDTDIPVTAMPGLVRLASEIDSSNIVSLGIDATMVSERYPGSTDLVPKRDQIAKLVAQLLADPTLRKENARIVVQNGTNRNGVASKVGDFVEKHGYVVSRVEDASRHDYAETLILDHSRSKKATLAGLAALLKVPARNIRPAPASDDIDITVIVGANGTEVQAAGQPGG